MLIDRSRLLRSLCIAGAVAILSACSPHADGSAIPPPLRSLSSALQASQDEAQAEGRDLSSLTFFPVAADTAGFPIIVARDGAVYYGTMGPFCSCGALFGSGDLGRLDPHTGSYREIALSGAPIGIFQTPDGIIWAAESSTGKLARFSDGAGFALLDEIAVPPTEVAGKNGFVPQPRSFAMGGDGNLWFSDTFGHRIGKISPAGPYETGAITMKDVPPAPSGTQQSLPRPFGMIEDRSGNLWFADFANGTVNEFNPFSGTFSTYVTPQQQSIGPAGSSSPLYLARSGSSLYLTSDQDFLTPPVASLDRVDTNGTFSIVPTFSNLAQGSTTMPDQIAADRRHVVYSDLGNLSIGIYSPQTKTSMVLPTTSLDAYNNGSVQFPKGVAIAPDGSVWFMCFGPGPVGTPLCLGHLVLRDKWALFPGSSVTMGEGAVNQQLIGIGERGNSGPFHVASDDSAVVSVQDIPGFSHDFWLTGQKAGTETVAVMDAHNHTEYLHVTVR